MAGASRTERKPRDDQLDHMVPCGSNAMHPWRMKVEPARERIRDRLRFIMKIETGEVAPTRVAAQLDESRAEHDAKREPPKQPEDQHRRRPLRKRPAIEQRTKE